MGSDSNTELNQLRAELEDLRHRHSSLRDRADEEIGKLRAELARTTPYATAQAEEIGKLRAEVERLTDKYESCEQCDGKTDAGVFCVPCWNRVNLQVEAVKLERDNFLAYSRAENRRAIELVEEKTALLLQVEAMRKAFSVFKDNHRMWRDLTISCSCPGCVAMDSAFAQKSVGVLKDCRPDCVLCKDAEYGHGCSCHTEKRERRPQKADGSCTCWDENRPCLKHDFH